jgi:hypothetical protein
MANDQFHRGFKAVRRLDNGPLEGGLVLGALAAGYGTAVYVGDPVIRVAAGANVAAVDTVNGRHEIGTVPEVALASGADGVAVYGVIEGFEQIPGAEFLHAGRASVARIAKIRPVAGVIFQIRDDGGAAVGAAQVGENAIYEIGTPSTTTLLSGAKLDLATAPSPDASNPLRIVALSKKRNTDGTVNDSEAAYALWEVVFNNDTEADGALGI